MNTTSMLSPISSLKIKPSKWPKGSEWRRWDLHVHTPESKLGAPFLGVSWKDYVTELEEAAKSANISVVGVTDYMTIDGYEKLLKEKKIGRLSEISLLIPNIEFRAMPNTSDGKALNIHLLIDPSEADHVEKIKRALENLKFKYYDQTYGCCRKQLIEFGRKQNPQLIDDELAYKFGIEQFKPELTVIEKWLDSEGWLRKNCLVGITNGKDGISGLPLDGFGAVRDEILNWCDFIFSGNPKDREHYLGLKDGIPEDEIIRQYGSLKPCIHGSDAHKLETLFKPDNDRYCWIKSDPTFNGLRQILWEPEERVHIGILPPQPSDHSQLIQKISISNGSGWFENDSIELNSGLVAVIGEKGAGKTAVTDLSSFAAGYPMDKNSLSSFITKGQLHLSGVKVKLEWGGGEETEGRLTDSPMEVVRPRVRYLSQDFVERICSSDHEGSELQTAIEEVIFAKLDETQKEGYSSFDELRKAREIASNMRKEALRGSLATLHKEVDRLQVAISQKAAKISSKNEAENQISELQKQLPDAIKSVDQKVLEQLEEKQTQLKEIQDQITTKNRRKRSIERAIESYIAIKFTTEQEITKIQTKLSAAEVEKSIIKKMQPDWTSGTEELLKKEVKKIDTEIVLLKGAEIEPSSKNSLHSLDIEIENLKEKVAKDEVSRKRLLDLQKQITERTATTERLEREIKNIDEELSKKIKTKKARQVELYLEVFKELSADKEGLKELYLPIQDAISKLTEEMQFDLSVGYQVDINSWLSKCARFFDGRRTGAEAKQKEIEKIVKTNLVPAWKDGDASNIQSVFKELLLAVDVPTFPEKYGVAKLSQVELYDWLFSVEHIQLTYKIHYSGTELEYLSPGTRGIALLVLYLLMDEDDTRPLLIDQPEGNLDNASVYKQLVPYIKKAKKRRQIILITHNPNLVVATDAEQIIIATAERPDTQPFPCIRYDSGSLEHFASGDELGIREAVCLLLEGGKDAFKARENRYSLAQT